MRWPRADSVSYKRALAWAEMANRLAPADAAVLSTLGVARYRAREYERAIVALSRSDSLQQAQHAPYVADAAFLAMSYHSLGREPQAGDWLRRVKVLMKDPENAGSEESQRFLREAEDVVEGKRKR